ncbi:MAG: alpha-2-macroglobulin [Planctomycetota bacterium]|nr:MAG: alpha-2-macroglobulin [Planctomycetota bacterium]
MKTLALLSCLASTLFLTDVREPGPPAVPIHAEARQDARQDYAALRARAEALFAEQSFEAALRVYEQARRLELAAEEARWVDFRLADAGWRSVASSRNPDTSALDARRLALEAFLAGATRPEDEDRVWAEVQESLGDFHWARERSWSFGTAQGYYRAALDWWAGARDVELARERWLAMLWRMARPGWFQRGFGYGQYGNWLAIDLLEDALELARTDDERARAHLLLARTLIQHSQGTWWSKRVMQHFEAAIALGSETEWYDDALYFFAEWHFGTGAWVRGEDGNLRRQVDYEAALGLYRRLLAAYREGASARWRPARDRITHILAQELQVAVDQFFLPGSEVRYRLAWRNLAEIELALYPVDLTRDVGLSDPDRGSREWLQSIALARLEPTATWRHSTEHGARHESESAVLALAEKPEPGAYVIVARAGALESRELVLVTDAALTIKASGERLLLWATGAEDGVPLSGADVTLHARVYDARGKRFWTIRSATTGEDGTALIEIPKSRYSVEVFASIRVGARQAFALVTSTFSSEAQGWRIYASTDRPAYRPEQTVQWKVLVRSYQGREYTTPAGERLAYVITDPRGTEVEQGELELSAFGSAWGSLETTASMPLGEYRVTFTAVRSGTTIGNATLFRLEEYKLPEFEVTVTTPMEAGVRKVYVMGDEVEAEIAAEYYFGGPVANAEVEVVVYQKAFWWSWRPRRPMDWFGESLNPSRGGWDRGPGQEVLRKKVRTDAEGHARVAFPSPEGQAGDLVFTVEARVTDASRREVTGRGSVRVMRHSYVVHTSVEHRLHRPGESITATFSARDANENPVARSGVVRLQRARWVEIWMDPAGREVMGPELARHRWGRAPFPPPGWIQRRAEYVYETVAESAVTTGADGQATWTVTPEAEGSYVVRWVSEDPRGGEVASEAWVWVVSPGTRDLGFHQTGVELVLDEETFEAGEPGHVMIVTEGAGRWVLFTVETERLLEHRVLHLAGTVKLVTIAIGEEHVPNIYLTATMVHGGRAYEALKQVVVPPVKQFLDVTVAADRESYLPGSEGTLVVTVRDHEGRPVQAEVALALVDESVMAIQEDYAGDPRAFFFGHKRAHGVRVGSSFHQKQLVKLVQREGELVDARFDQPGAYRGRGDTSPPGAMREQKAGLRTLGYASEEGAMDFADAFASKRMAGRARNVTASAPMAALGPAGPGASPVVVRSDFRETALWTPDLVTDEDGSATVTVRFPDSTTRWRATARVSDAGARFGHVAESAARTSMPLIVRLQAPRFFVVGDEVVISAILTNNTEGALDVFAAFRAEGLELLGMLVDGALVDSAGTRLVPGAGQARVDWRVRVREPGAATLTVTAGAGEYADAMRRVLPVYDHGLEVLISDAGKLTAAELQHVFRLPAARRAGSTRMTVRIAPSIAVTMLDALPYLVDYPYGCTEQTLSRFVPAAVVAKTLKDLGLDPVVVAERAFGGIEPAHAAATHPKGDAAFLQLAAVTRAGLDRIASLQRADGGWGWWGGGDSDVFMSAYAVWSLALARDAGLDFPEAMLTRGVEWLRLRIVEAEDRPAIAAWILHAVTAALPQDQAQRDPFITKGLDVLWEQRADLNAYTRALFALAAHELGQTERTAVLARNIANGVRIDADPGTSRIGGGPGGTRTATAHWGEDGVVWRWSDGGVEATAFCLRALLAIAPDNELIDPVVTWLVKNRRGAQWKSTRDTAIVVLALSDYLRTSGELTSPVAYELEVNGELVARQSLSRAELLDAPSAFLIEAPLAGDNTIRIRRTTGDGPLYWSVQATFFSEEDPIPARGSDLFVRRDYYRLVGRPTLLKGEMFERVPLADGDEVVSGERVEVVITVEAKNHLEYMIFEDLKPAGLEATELKSGGAFYARQLRTDELSERFGPDAERSGFELTGDRASRPRAGYTGRSRWVYRELRDRKVALFIDRLPEGVWEMRYVLRAEVPGTFHALPLMGRAMYVPEIRANSAELRLTVLDRP